MGLAEKNILSFGATRRMTGVVYEGEGEFLLVMLPAEAAPVTPEALLLNPDEWKVLLRQTDLMETEIQARDQNGELYRALVRKCERQVSQNVSWEVFRRDRFRCRYCGEDNSPLTVDHLVLWEEGGPTEAANLVACCKKCNATRGSQPYAAWLRSDYYKRVSAKVPAAIQDANEALVATLPGIKRVYKQHKR